MNNKLIDYCNKYQLDIDIFKQIYNLDKKMKFIEDHYGCQKLNAQQGTIRFMSNAGEYEKKTDKDLNKFNNIEMEELFKSLNVVSNATFAYRKTIVRKYFEWSFSEGLIKLKDFDWLENFSLDTMNISDLGYQKYFKDFDDLKNGVNTILEELNPIDKEQYAISIITIFLTWFGLTVEECCNLKTGNIDFENNVIKIENKIFVVNKYVVDIIKENMRTDGYLTSFKNKNAVREFKYKQSDYIIRRLISSNSLNYTEKDLQQRVSVFIKTTNDLPVDNRYYNHTFFLKDIRDSGAFCRLLKYEKENNINTDEIKKDVLLDLFYVNDFTISKENNLRQDYKKWKNIFYV